MVQLKRHARYSDHIDYLLASIVYLGTNANHPARTASALAHELSLEAPKLINTFEAFPGIFRKAHWQNDRGENSYYLQARYALRTKLGTKDKYPPLPAETLRLLYDFVQKSADEEKAGFRSTVGFGLTVLAAIASAAAAIYAASIDDAPSERRAQSIEAVAPARR